MELECYPTAERPPEIVPGRPQRAWMDRFAERHPYRCLPLTMANTTGWEILCPMAFTAEWNGGVMQDDIKLIPDRPHPDFHNFVKSHFSHGVMTFHPGYLFRTPPGWSMIAQGPPNHVKDGVQPLAGLVHVGHGAAQPHQGRHPAPGRPGGDRLAALPLHHELAVHAPRPDQVREGRAVLLLSLIHI